MSLVQLRTLREVSPDRSPLDFMGQTELAANLFRITQTEARLHGKNVRGQQTSEEEAHYVGREVRDTMKRISGDYPEDLPKAEDFRVVKSRLKKHHKKLKRLDSPSDGESSETKLPKG